MSLNHYFLNFIHNLVLWEHFFCTVEYSCMGCLSNNKKRKAQRIKEALSLDISSNKAQMIFYFKTTYYVKV